jgi:hypothetical protein
MRRRSQQAGQHQTDVGFRREVDGRFRKGPTAVMGRVLPRGDSPEAVVACRGSFRALKSRQLSGERHVRCGWRIQPVDATVWLNITAGVW